MSMVRLLSPFFLSSQCNILKGRKSNNHQLGVRINKHLESILYFNPSFISTEIAPTNKGAMGRNGVCSSVKQKP